MHIGMIGSGHIGSTLARQFVDHGHEVAVSNSRGPETLQELVAELGDSARALSADEAAKFGDVVVVSVPFGHYRDVPADGTAGKVVIDTNNYYPSRDGHFVVKAFNAIRWDHLRDRGHPEESADERIGIPISGDDPDAKRTVAELIDEIGFTAVDAGSLGQGGRKHQPGTPVYTVDLPAGELRSQISA